MGFAVEERGTADEQVCRPPAAAAVVRPQRTEFASERKTHRSVLPDGGPEPVPLALRIRYPATRVRSEWNELLEDFQTVGPVPVKDELRRVLKAWTGIDLLPTGVARIDRTLNPTEGRAADSLGVRTVVAQHLKSPLPAGTFSGEDVRSARNIFEHSDEYLPRSLLDLKGRPCTTQKVDPDTRLTP